MSEDPQDLKTDYVAELLTLIQATGIPPWSQDRIRQGLTSILTMVERDPVAAKVLVLDTLTPESVRALVTTVRIYLAGTPVGNATLREQLRLLLLAFLIRDTIPPDLDETTRAEEAAP